MREKESISGMGWGRVGGGMFGAYEVLPEIVGLRRWSKIEAQASQRLTRLPESLPRASPQAYHQTTQSNIGDYVR